VLSLAGSERPGHPHATVQARELRVIGP